MELPTGIGFALVMALVLANGFFVATEFALVAVRRSRIEQLAAEGNRTAVAAKDVVEHLDAYIAACQLGITMASLALGWIGEPVVAHLLEPALARLVGGYAAATAETIAIALAFALITALHIVIGELAPKGVALQLPERTTLFVTHPIRIFYRAFRWPIVALNAVGNAVLRVFGLRPSSGHEMVHSAEELRLLVSASGAAGTVEPSEARIASRAFRFADLAASELMTPRTEVVAVPVRLPAAELFRQAEASPYSRLLVYEGTLDAIVGVLRVRDLLRLEDRGETIVDLRSLAHPCPFVPHTKHADALLEEMQRSGEHLCAVVDEFGGMAGVVTLTDLLQALVGPIHDRLQGPGIGSAEPDGSRIFSGLVRLADLEEAADLTVDDPEREDADSLGGIIMVKLGRLPGTGDEVTVGGRRFRVEEVRRRRVTAARLLPVLAIAVLAFASGGCAHGRYGPDSPGKIKKAPRNLKNLTVAERASILARAQAWQAIDPSSLDILAGPEARDGFALDENVPCDYVKPSEPLTGNTPKFTCRLAGGDVVRVKYGQENGEVYGEVAGTRFLWALGFHADRAYPVRVTCRNCSPDPWKEPAEKPGHEQVFDFAVIERKRAGRDIEVPGFSGWSWEELDRIDERQGGAPRAHLDALKLAAAFMQHGDSKPEQQRLSCAPGKVGRDAQGNETCAQAFLVVNDVGATFGRAELLNRSKMTLAHWQGRLPWRDRGQCVANARRSLTGSLKHPRIREAGRSLFARQISRLSDRQIAEIFTAARVERRGETIRGRDGRERPVSIADWVRAFKEKRDAIAGHRCPG